MFDTQSLESLHRLSAHMTQRPVLVLTGAGISTASGIPDYRDTEGVRRGNAPIMHQDFIQSAATRKRYWARAMVGWQAVRQAQPNLAHRALAALQASEHVTALVTQNVDGLHDAAGSAAVIELHGNLHRTVCPQSRHTVRCGARQPAPHRVPGLRAAAATRRRAGHA